MSSNKNRHVRVSMESLRRSLEEVKEAAARIKVPAFDLHTLVKRAHDRYAFARKRGFAVSRDLVMIVNVKDYILKKVFQNGDSK